MSPHQRAQEILNDPEFQAFARRKNAVSFWLTLITIVVYFTFISLMAFGSEFMSHKVGKATTLGIPIGIGVILVSWLLTGIYVRWANGTYDAMVARMRAKVQGDS